MTDLNQPLRKQVSEVLQSVITWIQGTGDKQLIFGVPPLNFDPAVRLRQQRAKPLPDHPATGYLQMQYWPRQALNASAFPTLLFVVEGEAHFRIGVTKNMVKRKPALADGPVLYTVEMNAPACLLLPPGVPYSDAARPHWERDDKTQADSLLLWVNVQPEAGFCHLCRTQAGRHEATNALLVPDPQLFPLVDLLQQELAEQQQFHKEACTGLLQTLLLRTARGIETQEVVAADDAGLADLLNAGAPARGGLHSVELERACRYIKTRLGYPLSPAEIASHAFVSHTQLKRLFRTELSTSVMRYVKQQRMQTAAFYLKNSNMKIQEIAKNVGYAHTPQFNRDFAKFAGVTPGAYRGAPEKF